MPDEFLLHAPALVFEPFDLQQTSPPSSEAEVLQLLADRIAVLLETQPEYLMSLLYRLDVLEEKIHPVMQPGAPEPANWGLARLVLARQKQRIETKRSIKPKPLENMEGWEW